jgi:hypothetical protein
MKKLLIIALLFAGCKHDVVETTICGKDINKISYTADVKPIIKTHCIGCHSEYIMYDSLNASINSGDFAKRVLYKRDMPPAGGLDTCDYIVLKRWYYNGHTSN